MYTNKKKAYELGIKFNSNYKEDLLNIFNSDFYIICAFLRGYIETHSKINYNNNTYILTIYLSNSTDILSNTIKLLNDLNIIYKIENEYVYIYKNYILDILYILYHNIKNSNHNLYKHYKLLSNYYQIEKIVENNTTLICNIPNCTYIKDNKDAIIPFKNNGSNIGYNLSIIKHKYNTNNIYVYDTGLKIIADIGYYFEIVPNNKILEMYGYVMNQLYINPNYSKSITITLHKYDDNKPDFELPFQCLYLILKKNINYHLEEDTTT